MDESTWTICVYFLLLTFVDVCLADGKVEIILSKGVNSATWWSCVQIGHPTISVKDIEGAKYLDDSILKKIYEQKKKQKAEEEAATASGEVKKDEAADDK